MTRGRAQDKAILNMIADNEIDLNGDLKEILNKVKPETEDILEEDKLQKHCIIDVVVIPHLMRNPL